jgi:hypothetical protein
MAGFTKLWSSIVHSTVWQEPLHVKVTWVTMLALADAQGHVGASIPGLASAAGVTIPQCEESLGKFLAPDPYSGTKEHEGRRIEAEDGGWRLLTYEKHRAAFGHVVATLTTKGYVYYAQLGDSVKIGFSKNPWARMGDLRVTAPTIKLLAIEPGTIEDEQMRHQQFGAYRDKGEWFTLSESIKEHIATLTTPVATVATPKRRNATRSATKEAEAEAEADTETTKATTLPRKAAAGKDTWLTPFADAWKARFGGKLSFGIAAKELAPLVKEHGEAETFRRWGLFLADASGQYVSIPRFASTFGEWDGSRKPNGAKPTAGELTAASMKRIFSGPAE